ncbi:MAG: hypothetical protein ABW352_03090 [Polyangiales bacterium]
MEDEDHARALRRARAALRAELHELKQSLEVLLAALDEAPAEPEGTAVVTSVVSRPVHRRIPPR